MIINEWKRISFFFIMNIKMNKWFVVYIMYICMGFEEEEKRFQRPIKKKGKRKKLSTLI